ncbi:hypothetical protein [Ferrimonas pelagia]|uniref:cAMP-binding domain of CRP or a regulatory subunit of cAMP-dependent protein kinases n=1 Tax=Ferrimonas pelagia TaxID=1177826 RepID=A0ABP9F8B2_9GAMM
MAGLSWQQQLIRCGCDADDVTEVERAGKWVELAEGEIFGMHNAYRGLIQLEQGCLAREYTLMDGRDGISYLFLSGMVFELERNELFYYLPLHYRCLTPVRFRLIPSEALKRLKAQSQGVQRYARAHSQFVASQLEELAMLRQMLSKRDFVYLALLLMHDAFANRGLHAIPFSDDMLCRITGTTRQYFNGLMRDLVSKGLVQKSYCSLSVIDIDGVRALMTDDYYGEYVVRHQFFNAQGRIAEPPRALEGGWG